MMEEIKKLFDACIIFQEKGINNMSKEEILDRITLIQMMARAMLDKYKDKEDKYKLAWKELKATAIRQTMSDGYWLPDMAKVVINQMVGLETKYNLKKEE